MIRSTRDADGIVTWTWDTPDRRQNTFDQAALDAFDAVVREVAADATIRGVILTSAKDSFSAGGDLSILEKLTSSEQDPTELTQRAGALSRILRKLETCGRPVVAAVNGTALGGGFELALACHRRVVADRPDCKLGLPEATLGLLPGAGGTQRVPRRIGVQKSMGFLMEGRPLRPAEALELGLVEEVVPPAELLAAARAWLMGSPVAIQPWDRKDFKIPGGGPEDAAVANSFMVANAMYRAKTYGNYPAGRAILSCLWEGLRLGFDAGLAVENRYCVSLLLDPVSSAMIRTMFVNLEAANKLAGRPAGVPKLEAKKIGVLGAGLMGSGIAHAAASVGLEVVLVDTDQDRADRGRRDAGKPLDRAIAKGKATEASREALLARIRATTDPADLAGCELVVEAVFEDRAVKAAVTRAAEAAVGAGAVIASNTSTLPITGLAEACERPERFVGLHFFSPVDKMQLVEVIRGQRTSDATLAHALDFVQRLKKTPIVVRDRRGFYTSRVFGTYITEGLLMLVEGVKPALIENAGRMSGMPMPPLQLADEVGLALMHQVGQQTRADLGDDAPDNPSNGMMERMVVGLGRTGKRSGKGFYDYHGESKRLWTGLAGEFPVAAMQPEAGELIQRFLYAQAVEAARCVEDGLLTAADADVGAVLGWGFAPHTGGPMSMIRQVGPAGFAAEARRLADTYGERFAPPRSIG